jgi:hypothetical protein
MGSRFILAAVLGVAGLTPQVVEVVFLPATDADASAAKIRALQDLNRARNKTLDSLAAGEIDLWQAAREFREHNDRPPLYTRSHQYFPGDSEEECACRQVISWIGCHGPDRDRSQALAQQLEAELESWLRQQESDANPDQNTAVESALLVDWRRSAAYLPME